MLRVLGPLLCALWLLPALAQERQERIVESVLPALAYGPKCSSTLQLHNLSERSVILEVEGHRSGGGLVPLAGHASQTIRMNGAERVSYKLQIDEETTSAWAKVREIVPSPRLTPAVAVSGTTECVIGDQLRSTAREPAYPIRNPWFAGNVSEIPSEEILVINTSERAATAWLCYSTGNLYAIPSETRPTQLTHLCSSEAVVQIPPFGTHQFSVQRDHNSYFSLKTAGNGIVLQMLRLLDATVRLYKVDSSISFGHEEPADPR
ncbi:MAG: hypothetical protein DMG58_32315 [Acidobacteria bacterium]|nr:MAG: hypothetical protein DMG58_32315 [Acidobacteriota bacterium]